MNDVVVSSMPAATIIGIRETSEIAGLTQLILAWFLAWEYLPSRPAEQQLISYRSNSTEVQTNWYMVKPLGHMEPLGCATLH